MIELVRDILGSIGGSFAVVTSFMLVAAWGMITITRKITQHEDMVKHSSKSVDTLEDKIHLILKDLAYIKGTIQVMQSGAPTLIQSHSPISLTELGRQKAEEMRVSDMIAHDWEKIEAAVEAGTSGKNPAEIQQYCIETATVSLEVFFSPENVARVSKAAFSEGRPLGYYGGMIGVMIRDAYFSRHGIDVTDVDNFVPR